MSTNVKTITPLNLLLIPIIDGFEASSKNSQSIPMELWTVIFLNMPNYTYSLTYYLMSKKL